MEGKIWQGAARSKTTLDVVHPHAAFECGSRVVVMTFVCGPSAIAVQHANEAASLRSVHMDHMASQRFRFSLIPWRCGHLWPASHTSTYLTWPSAWNVQPPCTWLLDTTGFFGFHRLPCATDQLVGAGALKGPAVSCCVMLLLDMKEKSHWSGNFEVLIFLRWGSFSFKLSNRFLSFPQLPASCFGWKCCSQLQTKVVLTHAFLIGFRHTLPWPMEC